MEKKEYLVEITYHESGDSEVTTLKTDDLAWSMNQYQRNRKPFTWEMLEEKECCGDGCCEDIPTLEDVEMIQQGIENHESDNS
jgi:hypothetical protein|tara:strand:+ start:708 stop:956 length:249 start_codon:yes stop_codon:yes gene_type:complete